MRSTSQIYRDPGFLNCAVQHPALLPTIRRNGAACCTARLSNFRLPVFVPRSMAWCIYLRTRLLRVVATTSPPAVFACFPESQAWPEFAALGGLPLFLAGVCSCATTILATSSDGPARSAAAASGWLAACWPVSAEAVACSVLFRSLLLAPATAAGPGPSSASSLSGAFRLPCLPFLGFSCAAACAGAFSESAPLSSAAAALLCWAASDRLAFFSAATAARLIFCIHSDMS